MSTKYYDINKLTCKTTGGKAWLEKYLHPPGVTPSDYAGYPDDSVNSSIRSEYRLVNTVLTNTTGLPSTGALMLITPGVLHPVYLANKSSDTAEPGYKSIVPNGEITPLAAIQNYQSTRTCYQSTTMRINSTAFNNSGFFSIAQTAVTPYVLQPVGAFYRKFLEYKSGHIGMERLVNFVRHLVKKEHQAKFCADYLAKLIACFDQTDLDEFSFAKSIKSIPLTENIIQTARLGKTPRTPGDITDLSPKFAEIEAKEGCFIVAQKAQPVNDFKPVTTGYISSGTESDALTRCAYEYYNGEGTAYLEWFFDPFGNPCQDLPWSNFTWCHVMLTGLTPSTGSTAQPPVHIKHIVGTESIALPRSILNTQVTRPALVDNAALESAAEVVQARADGLLSMYNDLGGVGEALAIESAENPVLKTVLDTGGQTNLSMGGPNGRFAQIASGITKPITKTRAKSPRRRSLSRSMSKMNLQGRHRTPSKVRSNSRRRNRSSSRTKAKRVPKIPPRRRRRSRSGSKNRTARR